ncbi:HCO3- transporter family protein [Teladorsagia circumcincta]|uniref:HCO3-transporter family protein n=1 Tax=Teladorsagia circumcincta TaxID=45464 RepID=A0A2G9UCG9_TELCI|nr:HCO3- transporter family protein [Teladorsagia circumcincta]
MSALVGLISRFTEEAFATLISVVFIIQAFQKLLEISHDAPIVADPREVYESPCFCHVNETDPKLNITISMRLKDMAAEECEARGGEAIGLQCHFKPDVYMLSVLLTFGTFALAYGLNNFRHSRFFGSTVISERSERLWRCHSYCCHDFTILSNWIGCSESSCSPTNHGRFVNKSDWNK